MIVFHKYSAACLSAGAFLLLDAGPTRLECRSHALWEIWTQYFRSSSGFPYYPMLLQKTAWSPRLQGCPG